MGLSQEYVKEAYFIAGEAALALGDLAKVEELVAMVEKLPPGNSSQFLQGHSLRLRARLAALRGDADEAERLFKRAAARFRELGVPFYLGVTALEQGEWLVGQRPRRRRRRRSSRRRSSSSSISRPRRGRNGPPRLSASPPPP